MDSPPEKDRCETFYFNGVALPPHASWWPVSYPRLNVFEQSHEGDDILVRWHLWDVQTRLHHWGGAESEDPILFRLCAQEVLLCLILHRDDLLCHLAQQHEVDAEELHSQLVQGIAQMLHLCDRDDAAFWTHGDETHRLYLLRRMEQSRLPPDHPDHREAPHVKRRFREAVSGIRRQLVALRELAQNGQFDKAMRKLLLELPPPPAEV